MDYKRIISSSKGSITKIDFLVKQHEASDAKTLLSPSLDRLLVRLTNAESKYEDAYATIPEPTEDDDEAQLNFMSSVDDLRSRLEHLKLTIEAIAAGEDLEELIEYWESLSPDEQRVKVDREIDDLQYKLQAYIDLTRPQFSGN